MEAFDAEDESDNDTPLGDYIPSNDSFTNIPKIQFSPVNSLSSRSSSESDISTNSTKSSKFSHIHNYVISSLPSGNAKRNILGGIIDFDTPVNSRPSTPEIERLFPSRRSSVGFETSSSFFFYSID